MATITGTPGADTLSGTEGDDVIDGLLGPDYMYGRAGNDRFVFSGVQISYPQPPMGLIDGGDGYDEIDVTAVSPVYIYGSFSSSSVELTVGNQRFNVQNVERISLGNWNNTLTVFGNDIDYVTGSGSDVINWYGTGGINTGAGNDEIVLAGNFGGYLKKSLINGAAGQDKLIITGSDFRNYELDLETGNFGTIYYPSYSGEKIYYYNISGIENVDVVGGGVYWTTPLTWPYDPNAEKYLNGTIVRGDGANNSLTLTADSTGGGLLDGRGGNDILNGSNFKDMLYGGDGDDRIFGRGGPDEIYGGAGNDFIGGLADGSAIDGGEGSDIVSYAGLTRSYGVSSENAVAIVSSGGLGDTIKAVENIEFRDSTLTFDVDSDAAYVMRLYDTVLHREPDMVGLDAWLDRMDDGLSKADVAAAFVGSSEFLGKTGALSTADFVEFLYTSALGRSSDEAGKANWVANIDAGLSRAEAVIGFSESDEHRQLTADTLAKGLWVTDDNFQQVAALYDSFADRLPDRPGLLNWVAALESGMSLKDVATGFANSGEFAEHTAGLSNADLVDYMYMNTLDRGADAGGKQAWVAALEGGMTKGELLLGFSSSEEHFGMMHDHIYSGVDSLG